MIIDISTSAITRGYVEKTVVGQVTCNGFLADVRMVKSILLLTIDRTLYNQFRWETKDLRNDVGIFYIEHCLITISTHDVVHRSARLVAEG